MSDDPQQVAGVGWALAVPLTTARLVLRPYGADDLDEMYAFHGLPSVARYLYRPPHTREQCAQLIAGGRHGRWAADGDVLRLAICRQAGPGVVGDITLRLAGAAAGQAEIGWILHPAHERQGYATEAAAAVAAAAFDQLGVHRLYARLDVQNTGSARICERLGMRREAHFIENDLDGDRWGSEYVYAALARDLAGRRGSGSG